MSVLNAHPNIIQTQAPLPPVRGANFLAPHAERQPSTMQQMFSNVGTQLGTGLGQGVSNSVQSQMRRSLVDKTLGMLNPQMSPLEKYGVISQLDPELRKEVTAVMEGEAEQRAKQATAQLERDKFINEQAKEIRGYQAAQDLQRIKNQKKKEKGKNGEGPMSPEEHESFQGVFNRIGELYESGSLGFMSANSPWPTGYMEAKGELDALKLQIVNKARQLEQTGHINKEDLKNVIAAVPQSNDTLAKFRGKMRGISKIFGLDPGKFADYKVGQKLQAIPDPNTFPKNAIITDDSTGKSLINNGTSWEEMP